MIAILTIVRAAGVRIMMIAMRIAAMIVVIVVAVTIVILATPPTRTMTTIVPIARSARSVRVAAFVVISIRSRADLERRGLTRYA